jgi:hypothetical protein
LGGEVRGGQQFNAPHRSYLSVPQAGCRCQDLVELVYTVDCVVIYTVNDDGLITSIRAHREPDHAIATLSRP